MGYLEQSFRPQWELKRHRRASCVPLSVPTSLVRTVTRIRGNLCSLFCEWSWSSVCFDGNGLQGLSGKPNAVFTSSRSIHGAEIKALSIGFPFLRAPFFPVLCLTETRFLGQNSRPAPELKRHRPLPECFHEQDFKVDRHVRTSRCARKRTAFLYSVHSPPRHFYDILQLKCLVMRRTTRFILLPLPPFKAFDHSSTPGWYL